MLIKQEIFILMLKKLVVLVRVAETTRSGALLF